DHNAGGGGGSFDGHPAPQQLHIGRKLEEVTEQWAAGSGDASLPNAVVGLTVPEGGHPVLVFVADAIGSIGELAPDVPLSRYPQPNLGPRPPTEVGTQVYPLGGGGQPPRVAPGERRCETELQDGRHGAA